MEEEAVAIAGKDEGHLQGIGIGQGLLHAVAHGMLVVLGLDDGQRQVGLVVEDEVGAARLAPGMQPATDDDAALGEGNLLADLGVQVPARLDDGRRDELGADVPFGEVLLVHWSP